MHGVEITGTPARSTIIAMLLRVPDAEP